MQVNLKVGDIIGAEVIRIISGGLVVELDNCQETVIPPSRMNGKCDKDRLNRFLDMSIGSKFQVEVVSTFIGRAFKSCVSVKEVRSSATTAPARTGRILHSTR